MMTTIVEALRAQANILEDATEIMEWYDEIEEALAEVHLWRVAAVEIEEGRARAARLAEEIWRLTDSEEAIL